MNTLYQAQATATGGRTGSAASNDGRLAVTLDTPQELGGTGGSGTNPEQLFAAGYAACFLGALKYVAAQNKVKLSDATSVSATVGIGPRDDGKGFGLDIALEITVPDIDAELANSLIAQADTVCPYSHLARTGAAVRLSVV